MTISRHIRSALGTYLIKYRDSLLGPRCILFFTSTTLFSTSFEVLLGECFGFLDRNCSIEDQVGRIKHIKRQHSFIIENPILLYPNKI